MNHDNLKATYGKIATFFWFIFGIYFHIVYDGFGALFTLKSLLFFLVGMFVAALVIGGITYLIQRLIAKIALRFISGPSSTAASVLKLIGYLIFALDVVIAYVFTKVAFNLLYA
jgi:hypothetical protein